MNAGEAPSSSAQPVSSVPPVKTPSACEKMPSQTSAFSPRSVVASFEALARSGMFKLARHGPP